MAIQDILKDAINHTLSNTAISENKKEVLSDIDVNVIVDALPRDLELILTERFREDKKLPYDLIQGFGTSSLLIFEPKGTIENSYSVSYWLMYNWYNYRMNCWNLTFLDNLYQELVNFRDSDWRVKELLDNYTDIMSDVKLNRKVKHYIGNIPALVRNLLFSYIEKMGDRVYSTSTFLTFCHNEEVLFENKELQVARNSKSRYHKIYFNDDLSININVKCSDCAYYFDNITYEEESCDTDRGTQYFPTPVGGYFSCNCHKSLLNPNCDSYKDKPKLTDDKFKVVTDNNGKTRRSINGSLLMLSCPKCKGNESAYYNSEDKEIVCVSCRHIDTKIPVTKICSKCKESYSEYIWFDPNCCPNCGKSFVD